MVWRELIAYLNSDDTLEPGAVSRAVKALQEHPEADFVFGSCNLIDQSGKVIRVWNPPPFDLKQLVFGNCFAQQTVFFRRCVLEHIGYLNEHFHFVMDYEYWLRAAIAGLQFARMASPPLANFRQWSNAKSWSQYRRYKFDRLAMIQKHFACLAGDERARIAWAGAYHDAAWFEYAIGNTIEALRYFRSSLEVVPKSYVPRKIATYLFLLAKILLWTRIRMTRYRRVDGT